MYQLTEDELDSLHEAGNYKTLDIALFAACAGAFLTLLVTLLTVTLPVGVTLVTFVTLCFASGVGTIGFGGRAWLAWRAARKRLAQIKSTDRPDPTAT